MPQSAWTRPAGAEIPGDIVGAVVGGVGLHGDLEIVGVLVRRAARGQQARDADERSLDGRTVARPPMVLRRRLRDQASPVGQGTAWSAPLPPASAAGLVQPASIPSASTRPNRELAGGGTVDRNDAYVMTQPVWSAARQSGIVLERPAYVLPPGHGQARPQQDGRYHPRLHRLAVDLVADQRRQHHRALRVADQHHAAPVVVVRHVVIPRIPHVVVAGSAVQLEARAREAGAQARQRHLSVHRGEQPALRAKPRELLAHDVALFVADRHVAVGGRVQRHGGIDVEAVDGRLRVGRPRLTRQGATGRDHRGREVDGAGILAARPAEPRLGVAVVVGLGWGGGGRRRWRRRLLSERRRDGGQSDGKQGDEATGWDQGDLLKRRHYVGSRSGVNAVTTSAPRIGPGGTPRYRAPSHRASPGRRRFRPPRCRT